MTMKTLYTGRTTVTGGRDGGARSEDGRLELRLAFPPELGGDGQGANAEQLFGAAFAACFASTVKAVAKAHGHKLSSVEVKAEVDVLGDGAAFDLAARLEVSASGADETALRAIVLAAESACPYARMAKKAVATTIRVAEARR